MLKFFFSDETCNRANTLFILCDSTGNQATYRIMFIVAAVVFPFALCLALVTVGCSVAVVRTVVVDAVVVAGVAVAWCVSNGMPLVLVDVWHWC